MARLLFSFLIGVILLTFPAAAEPTFSIPNPAAKLTFTRDHRAHPEFKTEWWFLTASLAAEDRDVFKDGADFGIQLTFFRNALSSSESDWNQQYLAHAAVSDRAAGTFSFEKRYVRGGLGVGRIAEDRLALEQGGWSLNQIDGSLTLRFEVQKESGHYTVDLSAVSLPSIVLNGAGGYSKKGQCLECASHYYSIPRIELRGEISRGAERVKVRGFAWLDHEWMSGAIDPSQVGWDWFGLMLKDGRSLMAFQLRDARGFANFKSATLIDGAEVRTLGGEEFVIAPSGAWKSPVTGATYPNRWSVQIPANGVDLLLEPMIANQELTGEGQEYWEGAVRDMRSGAAGYAELTGYVKPVGRL